MPVLDLKRPIANNGQVVNQPPRVNYPSSDNMGESGLQFFVCSLLLIPLLRSYFSEYEQRVLVGGNQNFYYEQGQPQRYIAPDAYVIQDEVTPLEDVKSWKLWEHGGKGPALAVEVVSDEYDKDYSPELLRVYERLGVRELIRYDPLSTSHPRVTKHGPRRLLTHFVRDDAGRLVEQPLPRPGLVRSAVFGFWLVHQPTRSLRLALGPRGTPLWPTEAERAAAESERAAAESERATIAEATIERLQQELARLRGEPSEPAPAPTDPDAPT